jgi:hypothetical protein
MKIEDSNNTKVGGDGEISTENSGTWLTLEILVESVKGQGHSLPVCAMCTCVCCTHICNEGTREIGEVEGDISTNGVRKLKSFRRLWYDPSLE